MLYALKLARGQDLAPRSSGFQCQKVGWPSRLASSLSTEPLISLRCKTGRQACSLSCRRLLLLKAPSFPPPPSCQAACGAILQPPNTHSSSKTDASILSGGCQRERNANRKRRGRQAGRRGSWLLTWLELPLGCPSPPDPSGLCSVAASWGRSGRETKWGGREVRPGSSGAHPGIDLLARFQIATKGNRVFVPRMKRETSSRVTQGTVDMDTDRETWVHLCASP